jgi:hypothetical protein
LAYLLNYPLACVIKITENNFDGLTVTFALFVGGEEKENWIKETEIIFDF